MNEPLQLLKNANQEANKQRIKLSTLVKCYTNLAQGFHTVLRLHDNLKWKEEHNELNFKDCKALVCKSNYEVLTRLGLI